MEKRLCEICEIQAGGTPSRSNNEYWLGGGIPWVKISDIKGKYVDRNNRKQGNFLSYVDRAMKVFGEQEDIDRGTKRAWSKMQKRLKRQ